MDRWQVLYGHLRHWYGLSRYEKWVWIIGLFSSRLAGVFFTSSYLPEITRNSGESGRLGGKRQVFSFGAQIITFVAGIATLRGFGDNHEKETAMAMSVAVGIWVLIFVPLSYNRLPKRGASRPLLAGKTVVGSAVSDLANDTKKELLMKKYPEAFKYVIMRAFTSLGVGTIIGLSSAAFLH